jgi:hypothetical protein
MRFQLYLHNTAYRDIVHLIILTMRFQLIHKKYYKIIKIWQIVYENISEHLD